VTKNDQLTHELLDELMQEINEDRSGMHPSVTDLIDCLTKTYYNAQVDRPGYTFRTKLYFLIGLGLERALLVKRKGEPTYGITDGIHWHVDSVDQGLLELKSTRANPNKGEDGFSGRWLKQVKSYLSALNRRTADLVVIYLIQPELIAYRLTFEQMELDMNWEVMKGRRDVWNRHQELGTSPKAFTYNEEWECKDCVYKLICETKSRMGL
jgi:hypothetical protein